MRLKGSLPITLTLLLAKYYSGEFINDVVSVANKAFNEDLPTTVVWWSANSEYITRFLTQYEGSVINLHMNTNYEKFYKFYKQTIFFTNDFREFEYFLLEINVKIVVPIRIVLVLSEDTLDSLSMFTEIAFDNDIEDIVVMISYKNETKLSTYIPYGNGICGNTTAVYLNSTANMFPKKYRNFHGCPVRITALNFIPYVNLHWVNNEIDSVGGFDGGMVKHVLHKMNATQDIVVSNDHEGTGSYVNQTPSGSFGDLVQNIADIMIPSILMTIIRYESAQISYVYDTFDLVWCMPKRREYLWAKIFLPFYNLYTLIIVLSFFVFVASIKFIKTYRKFKYKKSITFNLYGLFFTQIVKFRTASWLVNCLLLLWVWYSFFVRIAYQGSLVEGLGHSIFEPAIETVEEAFKFVDGIGGPSPYVELYRNTSIEKKYKSIHVRQVPTYLKRIAMGEKFLLVLDEMVITLHGYDVQVLKERVANALACIHMRPRWPAAKEVNYLITGSVETGIASKIFSDTSYGWVFKFNGTHGKKNIYAPLNMATMSSCFYGLIAMWIACFFILIIEILKK